MNFPISRKIFSIFKKGSTTFFYSSLFFPNDVRKNVFDLYAFVRVVDDFVDVEHSPQKFYEFKNNFYSALESRESKNEIISNVLRLINEEGLERAWFDSFFDSMEMDLNSTKYETIFDLEKYIYGSAEVIGLMMAKLMKLPYESFFYAQQLGKAYQLINFIRDIYEDLSFDRIYIPQEDLNKFNLDLKTVDLFSENFKNLIKFEVQRYRHWHEKAKKGFYYIPKNYLIPIRTSSDMFDYTADIIEKNPSIIFQKKVKPSSSKVIYAVLKNSI